MEIECLPYDEENAEDCAVDFEAGISESGREVLINNKFKNPPKISQNEGLDKLIIKFWGAPLLRTEDNKQIFAYAQIKIVPVPKQIDQGDLAKGVD